MDSMTIQIVVPVLPEGWRVVGRRKVRSGDMWLENDGWEFWEMNYPSTSIQIVAERIPPPIVLNPLLAKVLPDGWIVKEGPGAWYSYESKPKRRDGSWCGNGKCQGLGALRQDLFPDVEPEDSLFEIRGEA